MSTLATPTGFEVATPAGAPEQTTDRRAARRALTELALRAAAVHLTEERGFDGFTVDEVAQRAGVSPRTFFNYFPTKEAAVLSDPEPVLEAMVTAFRANDDKPVAVALRAALDAFFEISTRCARDMRREMAIIEATPVLRTALLSRYCAFERKLAPHVGERLGVDWRTDPVPLSICASVLSVARTMLMQWSWTDADHVDPAAVDAALARMSELLDLDA